MLTQHQHSLLIWSIFLVITFYYSCQVHKLRNQPITDAQIYFCGSYSSKNQTLKCNRQFAVWIYRLFSPRVGARQNETAAHCTPQTEMPIAITLPLLKHQDIYMFTYHPVGKLTPFAAASVAIRFKRNFTGWIANGIPIIKRQQVNDSTRN